MAAETRDRDYDQPATGVTSPEDAASAAQTTTEEDERPASRRSRRFPSSRLTAGERDVIAQKSRDVDFPVAMRRSAWHCGSVCAAGQSAHRELEMSASPESAVRHALEEVSEETHDLLQRAHETAEEITAKSRSRSDERLQQAEREADAMREAAAREMLEMRETVGGSGSFARRPSARPGSCSPRPGARPTSLRAHVRRRSSGRRASGKRWSSGSGRRAKPRSSHTAARRDSDELRTTVQRTTEEQRRNSQRDAEQMREAAETYVRKLHRNCEFLWRERRHLVDDMGSVGKQMADIAEAEARRFRADCQLRRRYLPSRRRTRPGGGARGRCRSVHCDNRGAGPSTSCRSSHDLGWTWG